MTKPCLPPRAVTSVPHWKAPADSTDCHFHINGPYDRYPLSPGRYEFQLTPRTSGGTAGATTAIMVNAPKAP